MIFDLVLNMSAAILITTAAVACSILLRANPRPRECVWMGITLVGAVLSNTILVAHVLSMRGIYG